MLKRQMLYASAPNECLQIFRDHLDEVERVLPIDSWFYIRARSIASAGAS